MKTTEPTLPTIVKKYTPRPRKSGTHIAMEWPIPRWIKLYEELIIASHRTNPAELELRHMAREIKEEIVNVIPKTY